MLLLLWFSSYLFLGLVLGFRLADENRDQVFHLWLFGQNVWGNLARGSTADCPITTEWSSDNKFLLANGSHLDPESVPKLVENPFHACPVARVGWDFIDPFVALGATWTHVVEKGELYSAGWCGDGACGWRPSIQTKGMKGEHAVELVKASDRWPNGSLVKGSLLSASAAYTNSLLLSSDGKQVYFIGLATDVAAMRFGELRHLQRKPEASAHEPVLVWEANEGQVAQQVVATYESSLILLQNGTVLIINARGSEGFRSTRTQWSMLTLPIPKGTTIRKVAGNGWTQYGALTSDGTLFYWKDSDAPKMVETGFKVKDFALGPSILALISEEGKLHTQATGLHPDDPRSYGALGRNSASDLEVVENVTNPFKEACAGLYYTAGLTESREVYVFGSMEANTYGAKNSQRSGGRQIYTQDDFGGEDLHSISCGFYHIGVVTRA